LFASLYHQPTGGGGRRKKRESCASDVTMTTFVSNLNNGQPGQLRISPVNTNGNNSAAASNALLVTCFLLLNYFKLIRFYF